MPVDYYNIDKVTRQ